MEFRQRTLPRKYLKKRKLLQPRTIQGRGKGALADDANNNRSGGANSPNIHGPIGENKEGEVTAMTVNISPSSPAPQASIGHDIAAYPLDKTPTSRERSTPGLDTSKNLSRNHLLSRTGSKSPTPGLQSSPGPNSSMVWANIVPDVNDRPENVEAEQVQVGPTNVPGRKNRLYAVKRTFKKLRRKIDNFVRELRIQAAMARVNFSAYMQRVYYR